MRNTVQQFHLAPSPYLFLDRSYRIVYVDEGLRVSQAAAFGLKPLVLYGLAWDKGYFESLKLSLLQNPASLRRFLYDNWQILNEEGCLPLGIKIGERYLDNIPWLEDFAKSFGIEILRTSTTDISYRSALRSLQARAVGGVNMSKTIASFNATAIHCFYSQITSLHFKERDLGTFQRHSVNIPLLKSFCRGDVTLGDWAMRNQARIQALPPGGGYFR